MIIGCGDIHGEFNKFMRQISEFDLRDCVIFQAGDFGMGFECPAKDKAILKFVNKHLAHRNIHVYAIRGNHDNPAYFVPESEFNTSNITLVPDYTVINIDGRKVLCVGGAISIDRKPNNDVRDFNGKPWPGRKLNTSYWADEAFILDEEKLKTFTGIDIVVTHSAPQYVQPWLKHSAEKFFIGDETLSDELNAERGNLSKMYEILKINNTIKIWMFGHFHFSNHEVYENTSFYLLDCHEFKEINFN